ncbi:MAG TPA: PAS domain S-box protein [Cytophagales bacterium]
MERFFSILFPDGSLSLRTPYAASHPGLLWTNVIADGLLAGAFFVIALVGLSLAREREKPGALLLGCGALFAGCCGLLHALQVVAVWWPAYWLEGMLRVVTALAALTAAVALLVAAPMVRLLPTLQHWERTNQALRQTLSRMRQKDETIRQSQEALQEAEERYGVLMQLFDSTVIHVDRTIVFANPAAARLFGAAHPGELVGKSILSFTHPDYRETVQNRLAGADGGQTMPLMEQKIVRLDGQAVAIEATAAPVTYAGKPAVQSIMRDVTERKRQEDRFRLLAEATNDVIWDADLAAGSLWWNDNYKKQFGYPEAEADPDLSWYGRMHPEDAARVAATMQQAEAAGQRQWRAEYRFRRADGEYADVLDRAYIIRDSAGKAIRAIGSMVDVTALRKTRAELALAEERFRLVAKATNDFVYDWNVTDDAMWWNEQFREAFGYREADLQPGSTAWTDRLHPDDRNRVWDQMHEAFREGHAQTSFEYRFRKPDGTYAYILERGYILYGGKGVPVRMVGSMADLSPLRQAQEELEKKASALEQFNAELEESGAALRESLAKFQAVFDSNMIGIFFWSLNGAVMDANDEFLAATGYSRQDLESGRLNWAHLTPEDHRPADEKAMREIRQTGVNVPYEKEYFRKDGSRVPVIVGGALLEGYANLGIGFLLNISERKKADRQLRHTLEELKKRNYELDTYVYKVSHDLRAPLASILGLINILKEERDLDTVHHYIALMENRASKLDVFIQSILAHSRTNSTEVQVGPVCFDKIIRESFEDLRYLPRFEKVKLVVKQQGGEKFYSDELKVSIVLKNFLSNAIKYSNPHVEESFVDFSILNTPTEAVIVIHDNGIGIEPQYVDRIFDMFFRGTEKSDGSGLGLYIVKQTIEKLGGSITVESHPGQGTMFRIVLPNLKEKMV